MSLTTSQIISQTELIKTDINKLKLGMYVSKLDRPWLETTFLLQGFPLNNEETLKKLQATCKYVYIDERKSKEIISTYRKVIDVKDFATKDYQHTVNVEDEIKSAHRIYEQTSEKLLELLKSSHKTGEVNARMIKQCVKTSVESIVRNPNAMIWLSHIKNKNGNTYQHSLRVGILAIALGRQLGLPRQQLETLGLCGMLHDVGKVKINTTILKKADKLTNTEYSHLKSHIAIGRDMLLHDQLLPPEVLETAYSHHERMDGEGYPEGLTGAQLSFYTRIVSIVDAYDTMTSNRAYAATKSSANAIKEIYANKGTQFDQTMVVRFIETIGLYPPGCIVELSEGEVGVVIAADPASRLLPTVALLRDSDKMPMYQTIINLCKQNANGSSNKIARVLKDGAYGISLEKFTMENINLNL
jgi:putative nucleotidyltransferase with HDIG domain